MFGNFFEEGPRDLSGLYDRGRAAGHYVLNIKGAGRKTRDLLELEKIMEDLIYGRLGSV